MSKKVPKISIIMPAYNAEQYITLAIDSVLKQSFKDFELIIIDDSSTDKTRKIINSYLKKDNRIRVIKTSHHNIAKVLNAGIETAKANIVARMDADDIALSNRLQKQYKLITSSTDIAVVGANVIIIDSTGKETAKRQYPHSTHELKKCLFRYSPFAHPVVMFRKDHVIRVGGYNPKYSPTEDLDLWFRLGALYRFESVPEDLLFYRIHNKSSSHKMVKDVEKLVFEIRFNAIKKYGYKPSPYDLTYNILQFLTLWFTPVKYRITLYNLLRNNNLI